MGFIESSDSNWKNVYYNPKRLDKITCIIQTAERLKGKIKTIELYIEDGNSNCSTLKYSRQMEKEMQTAKNKRMEQWNWKFSRMK